MYSLLLLSLISFLVCIALTPVVREIFCRLGIVDQPDHKRKIHRRPIPRVGGVAIALSFSIALGLIVVTHFGMDATQERALSTSLKILPAAGIVFLTGFLDDLFQLRPWQKLIGLTIAAYVAYAAGIQVHLFGAPGEAWLSLPLTIGWLLICSNALNLVDGVDGLATGVGLLATLAAIFVAIAHGDTALALAAAPLAGCMMAFLIYNFSPASIFLGDCGSLLIGFLIGCFAILWSRLSLTPLEMAAPVIAVSLPLFDTSLAIARRLLRNQPIFAPDRGHIHHRLLDRGLSPRSVALILYGICTLATIFALSMLNPHLQGVAVAGFVVLVVIGFRKLNYLEFFVAGRMIAQFRNLLGSQILLCQLESKLANARTPDECWTILRMSYKDFGFLGIRMRLLGQPYFENADELDLVGCWRLEIPISEDDRLELVQRWLPNPQENLVGAFAHVVCQTIGSKIVSFQTAAEFHTQASQRSFPIHSGDDHSPMVRAPAMASATNDAQA